MCVVTVICLDFLQHLGAKQPLDKDCVLPDKKEGGSFTTAAWGHSEYPAK
jgi:hypothetical protein